MTLTVNKKTYEAGELVAYVKKFEKENANLNANLKVLRKYELNVAKVEIEKLEKENTELKAKANALENANKAMVKELDDMTSGGISVLKNVVRSKEYLTQAKELLKKIEKIVYNGENEIKRLSKIADILAEAEQFLKGVSE